jgi:hypothetical protein
MNRRERARRATSADPMNLAVNGGFELDTNSDGLADSWTLVETVSGTPTTTRVAGRVGGWAQRMAFTSSGDSAKTATLRHTTAAGSFAEGNTARFSCYLKG